MKKAKHHYQRKDMLEGEDNGEERDVKELSMAWVLESWELVSEGSKDIR